MLEVLMNEKQRTQIVPILGIYGIGKSTLARNVLHFVANRKYFTGGVVYVQIKDIRNNFAVLKLIMRAILTSIDLNEQERLQFDLEKKLQQETKMVDFIVDIFNNRHEFNIRNKRRGSVGVDLKKKNKMFLLCIDNASALMQYDKEKEFVAFLEHLNDHCPNLRIIITSNRCLQLPPNISSRPVVLQQLRSTQSARLFLDICEQYLQYKELQELILKDADYPYDKCVPEIKVTENLEADLNRRVRQFQNWPKLLALHDLFSNLLMGNPTTITIIASCVADPMLQTNLVNIYTDLKQQRKVFINELDFESGGKSRPVEIENIMSLQVASEMSVKLLEELDPNHKNLLYFLGCLPGGFKKEQLYAMWGTEAAKNSL